MSVVTGLGIVLIPIICALFWIGVVAPTILRSFGVPIAFGFWRLGRRNERLSKAQYVWAFGVFSWAGGMFLFLFLHRYLEWKLLGDRFPYPTPRHIIVGLLQCLLLGWLVGVLSSPNRKGTDPTPR